MKTYGPNGYLKSLFVNAGDISDFRHAGTIDGSGVFYPAGVWNATNLTTVALAANNIWAVPFICPNRYSSITGISVIVTTAAAGSGNLGVYKNSADDTLYPSGLITQTTEFSVNSIGPKAIRVSLNLNPGQLIWLTYWQGAAATVKSLQLAGQYSLLGFDANLNAAPNHSFTCGPSPATYAANFGRFPNTFPSGANFQTAVGTPAIFVAFGA